MIVVSGVVGNKFSDNLAFLAATAADKVYVHFSFLLLLIVLRFVSRCVSRFSFIIYIYDAKIKKIAFNYIFSTELRCWVFTFTTDLKSWWYPYPYETFGSRQIDQNYFSPKSIILRKSWQIHKKGFCSLFEMPLPFYNEFFHSCYSPPLSSKYSLEKVYFEPMHL